MRDLIKNNWSFLGCNFVLPAVILRRCLRRNKTKSGFWKTKASALELSDTAAVLKVRSAEPPRSTKFLQRLGKKNLKPANLFCH